jgi:hypothetical protein
MDSRGEQKLFLQGLIQSAVGVFHCMSGNPRGAFSQLTRGLEKLEGYRPSFEGVDVEALSSALERLRAAVAVGLDSGDFQFDPALVPAIDYRPSSSISPDSDDQVQEEREGIT